MGRPLAAALLAVTLLIGTPATGWGESSDALDYEIPNGHFYTQSNGLPSGASTRGYSVTDDFGVPFWSEFQRLGGVERLGYPVTRRFLWHGLIGQAMQKAVLQFAPDSGQVQIVNVLDYLADAGKEDWLQKEWLVPPRAGSVVAVSTDTESVVRWLLKQEGRLDPLRRFYTTAPDPIQLYGLPTSPPKDLGDLIAWRFQRSVLQLWKVSGPGVKAGSVTTLNVGELVKASGVLPGEVLEPQEAPSPEARAEGKRQRAASRGLDSAVEGVATWYGWDFHGQEMRNGEIYNAEDPTIAAANVFPLGTWLRVTNLDTGASIEVRVTDTGAFRSPIVVDLSWAAFQKLAHPGEGVINVVVRPTHRD